MKRVMLATMLALALCACQSEQEKLAEWQKFCQPAFNDAQCRVLFAIKQSSDNAQADASSAAVFSGVAMGLSAGGRR